MRSCNGLITEWPSSSTSGSFVVVSTLEGSRTPGSVTIMAKAKKSERKHTPGKAPRSEATSAFCWTADPIEEASAMSRGRTRVLGSR